MITSSGEMVNNVDTPPPIELIVRLKFRQNALVNSIFIGELPLSIRINHTYGTPLNF